SRPQLVEPACGEPVQAHEGMGPKGGFIGVGGVRGAEELPVLQKLRPNLRFEGTVVKGTCLGGGDVVREEMGRHHREGASSSSGESRLRCRYNHSERKNHTKFFAEPPPHWSTTKSQRFTPSLYRLFINKLPPIICFPSPFIN